MWNIGEGKGTERKTNLLGGDGDLDGLLVGLLFDEPHHLQDLLGDLGVVHLGGGGGSDGPLSVVFRFRRGATTARGGWGDARGEGEGARESTGVVEMGVVGASLGSAAWQRDRFGSPVCVLAITSWTRFTDP